MMNNISLVPNNEGYDWNISNKPTVMSNLLSSIVHQVNMRLGEVNTSLYNGTGCNVYDFLYEQGTEKTEQLVKEILKTEISKIISVNTVELDVSLKDNIIEVQNMTITRIDGSVVTIAKQN